MIHRNTRTSYDKCKADGNYKRIIHRIARFFENNKFNKFTDRDVKDQLILAGDIVVNDMNMVRPKITKLISDGLCVEDGSIFDTKTDRNVRLVRWARVTEQQDELF